MLKNRAFVVQMVKTPNQPASDASVKRLDLNAPQVKQIALIIGAAYTYMVVLHTARDIAIIKAWKHVR